MSDTIEGRADGQLYKAHVIRVDPLGEGSTQPSDDPDLGTPDDAIAPPESMERLALWSAINGTRGSCIAAIAKNTVGLGYELEADPDRPKREGEGESDLRDKAAQARRRLEEAAARDTRLGNPTLTELLEATKTDEEETGWGFLEIGRNRIDGKVDGLYHLPAKRMRRKKDRSGYLLLPPSGDANDATYFVPFGSKVEYDGRGKPKGELREGHPGGWRRNEVLMFKLYTSESRDYGLPRDHALAVEYLGDKYANEANVSYFENGGALPTVLFVQGEEKREGGTVNVHVPAETTERINSVLRAKGRGPTGTGRVAVIPLPAGVKAQKEILGQISERDIGFVGFRDDMRQRTLSAFRLGPIFIALADEGRYSAEVQRALAKEQVFDGEQARYESRLSPLLNDMGFPELVLVFKDLAVEDDAAKRDSAEKMAEVGTIKRGEHRKAHGFPALPEAERADEELTWTDGKTYQSAEPGEGQVPYGWNDAIVEAGRPAGAENRVVDGDDQRGLEPGKAGRRSRDRGQAAEAQTRRLARRNGTRGQGGARRALERAKALPEED